MNDPTPRRIGLVELILGSLLSLLLGVMLAGAYLMFKPVEVVRELPKEPKAMTVYYMEGRKDWASGRQWMLKREAFMQAQTVRVTEEELNAWIESIYPPPPPPAKTDKEADLPLFQVKTPVFRIGGERLVVGLECQLNIFGFSQKVQVQAEGSFIKTSGKIVFEPGTFFLGSLPVHKLRPATGFAFARMVGRFEIPADLLTAWDKLGSVRIESNQLVLVGAR